MPANLIKKDVITALAARAAGVDADRAVFPAVCDADLSHVRAKRSSRAGGPKELARTRSSRAG